MSVKANGLLGYQRSSKHLLIHLSIYLSAVMLKDSGRSTKGRVPSDSEGDREGAWGRLKALMLL